jgi:hypothetical protein
MLGQSYAAPRTARSRFFVGIALAAATVVFAGFAQSYYLRTVIHLTRFPSGATVSARLSALIQVHGLVSTAWLLLLIAQTSLVASGRVDRHRQFGVAGAVLAVAVVVLGLLTAVRGVRDGWNPGGPYSDSVGFLAVTLGDVLLFAVFVGAGIYYRRRIDVHKRLMVLGTLAGLMWPAITRIPYVAPDPVRMFGLLVALVAALPVHDYLTERRVHPVSMWGVIVFLGSFPLRIAVGTSLIWHHLVARVLHV